MDTVCFVVGGILILAAINGAFMLVTGHVPPGNEQYLPQMVAMVIGESFLGSALMWFGWKLRKTRVASLGDLVGKYAEHEPNGFFERIEQRRAGVLQARADQIAQRHSAYEAARSEPMVEVQPQNAVLAKGEVAYDALPAQLFEPRTVSYKGRSSGVSLRVAKGVTVRTGGYRGSPVRRDVPIANGELVLTDRRIIFAGDRKSVELKLASIVRYDRHSDGITIGSATKTCNFVTGGGVKLELFSIRLQRLLG